MGPGPDSRGQGRPGACRRLCRKAFGRGPAGRQDGRVRRMAAISLGRMKTEDGLSMLRKFYTGGRPTLDPVHNACGWAIEQITGEVTPAAGTFEVPQRDWFLTPID